MFASKKAEARKKWREEWRETGEEGGMKPLVSCLFHFTKHLGYVDSCAVFFSDLIFFSTSSVCGSLCSMLSRLTEIIKGIMLKIVGYL